MSDSNILVRCDTLLALGRLNSQPDLVVPALTNAFSDPVPKVRMFACMALETVGERSKQVVPTLREAATHDPDPNVRENAAMMLHELEVEAQMLQFTNRAKPPNLQRMELTGARVWRPHRRAMLSRGASIPSGVEPARRRFVKTFSYADCFFRRPLASSTYAKLPDLRHSRRGLPPSGNRPMMTDHDSAVQSNDAAARHTSGSNLTPGSWNLRQARRAAAGFNKSPEPTGSGAFSCPRRFSFIHIISCRWLSLPR